MERGVQPAALMQQPLV